MEVIESNIREKVMTQMNGYYYSKYTEDDVRRALEHDVCTSGRFQGAAVSCCGTVP